MQSISLCLGEIGKLSDETHSALEKIRNTFIEMSKIPIQLGDLKVEGILCSLTLKTGPRGLLELVYLECDFTSLEERGH